MNLFGQRLKELRTQKKMSQKELADLLNMKRENVSNYERGTVTNVSSETISKISDLFNVSTDYLLGRSDYPMISAIAEENFPHVISEDLDKKLTKDDEEADLLAAFRLESEDMSAEEKQKFNNSLKGMMKIAKGLLNDDSNWKE